MKTISATEAKTDFGKCISMARVEPISIIERGQEAAVLMSEDYYWTMRTKISEKSGYLGTEVGQKIIDKILGVSSYKVMEALPKEFENELPSAEQLQTFLSIHASDEFAVA